MTTEPYTPQGKLESEFMSQLERYRKYAAEAKGDLQVGHEIHNAACNRIIQLEQQLAAERARSAGLEQGWNACCDQVQTLVDALKLIRPYLRYEPYASIIDAALKEGK